MIGTGLSGAHSGGSAGTDSYVSNAALGINPDDPGVPVAAIRAGFRSGYVFELRDLREPIPIQVHVLVLNPRSYTLSEPFQSTLTPTEDNTVVAEETGI